MAKQRRKANSTPPMAKAPSSPSANRYELRAKPWVLSVALACLSLLSFFAGFGSRRLLPVALMSGRSILPTAPTNESRQSLVNREGGIVGSTVDSQEPWVEVHEAYLSPGQNAGKDRDSIDHEEGMLARHLLAEVRGISKSKISTKAELSHALLSIAKACNLRLTSYTCTELSTTGIACIGLLVDGHMFLHSWATTDEVTLDIFKTNEDPLYDLLKDIRDAFQPYRTEDGSSTDDAFDVVWVRKLRGARNLLAERPEILKQMEELNVFKNKVVSVRSNFQKIDIIDFFFPRQEYALKMAMKNDPEYVARNPQLFLPDRALYLDGVMQSRRAGNAAYHEALVQPSMFAHPNPKRVAVIGGGEYATLREILKHNTVERAVMIDIDQMILDVSQEHLQDWNDCSDFIGSSRHCKDDPRSEVYTVDAFKWFMDRYLDPNSNEPPFDVIIMDALDPQNVVEFAGALYGDGAFLKSLYNALSDNGILISQVGIAPKMNDPSEQASISSNRDIFIESLVELGFQSIIDYEEGHCGFGYPWSFRVAFKDNSLKANWRSNGAEVEYEIQKRSIRTHSGQSPFLYFDGSSMQQYHYPSKASEVVFCRTVPTPEKCIVGRQPYPNTTDISMGSFEVKESKIGKNAGRGVFAQVDIPEHSYISLRSSVIQVHFPPKTYRVAVSTSENKIGKEYYGLSLDSYMHGYGWNSADRLGAAELHVDSDLLAFVNHGCNGTANIGDRTEFNEFTADVANVPDQFRGPEAHKANVHNPLYERSTVEHVAYMSQRKIQKGEELLENYLAFSDTKGFWEEDVLQMRAECSGAADGIVELYEKERYDEL